MNRDIDLTKHTALLTFATGALAGIAAALLFAPQSGDRSRSAIRRGIAEGLQRGREARARLRARGQAALDGLHRKDRATT